nr:type II toxin-antitoxin system YafQ family toxin [Fibrobacter intestinalis]
MIYEVIWTNRFKKSYKRCKKRGLPIQELKDVVEKLRNDIPLDEKFRDHELSGRFAGTRELHIRPDWLLCYRKNNGILTLTLVDTGSHSDLFGL